MALSRRAFLGSIAGMVAALPVAATGRQRVSKELAVLSSDRWTAQIEGSGVRLILREDGTVSWMAK